MITAADGTAFTGTVTAYFTLDGGSQTIGSVGSGVCTHEGNGFHTYAPAQAETNGDHVAFTFIGTSAINSTVQVYPSFPQTVDNNVLAAGATGFAAINTDVEAILADTNELQGDWANAGRLDTILDTIAEDTTTDIPALIADVPTVAEFNARTLVSADYTVVSDLGTVQTADHTAAIADIPTTAEFELRTLPSADYVVTTDTIAGVTLVDTVTDVTNEVTADVTKISGSAAAANNLEASALTILSTYTAVTGTLSTTQMTTDLTEVTDDHYNGRIIIWTSGVLQNQATNITDYDGASKMLTFTATTEAPSNLDTFVIV